MSEGTIVERLQTQRTVLVDVVHQIDTAITALGGTVSPNRNGNGTVAKAGRGKFWATKSAAERRRITAKRLASRRANRLATPTEAPASF